MVAESVRASHEGDVGADCSSSSSSRSSSSNSSRSVECINQVDHQEKRSLANGTVSEILNMHGVFPPLSALKVILLLLLSIELTLIEAHCSSGSSSETIGNPLVRKETILEQMANDETSYNMEIRLKEFIGSHDYLNNSVDHLAMERFHQLVSGRETANKKRRLLFDDTIFTRRALNERKQKDKFNTSYEGRLKKNPEISLVILFNETTIFITRWANKYYYWEFGQTAIALIIFVMIVVGNLSILHRLKSCRRRRSNVNYFIVQLAIADLFVGIFNVTLDSILRLQRDFTYGQFACLASKYISVLFLYSSTYLLVALSIDRWEAVVKPLAFTKNQNRGSHLVSAAWGLSLILALPVTLRTNIKVVEGFSQCYTDFDNFGWKVYMVYVTCTILVIPALIIAVCYVHIVYTIWRKGRLVVDKQTELNKREKARQALDSLGEGSLKAVAVVGGAKDEPAQKEKSSQILSSAVRSNGLSPSSLSSVSSASTIAAGTALDSKDKAANVSDHESGKHLQLEIVLNNDDDGEEEDELSLDTTEDDYVSTDDDEEYYEDARGQIKRYCSNLIDMNQSQVIEKQINGVQTGEQSSEVPRVGEKQIPDGKLPQSKVTCHELKELCPSTVHPRTRSIRLAPGLLDQRAKLERRRSKRASQLARRGTGSMRNTAGNGSQQHGRGVIPKARIKTIKMTLVIVLAFILCWVPFCIINLCHVFKLLKNDTYFSTALMTLSQSLAHLNSAMNPIIFWLFSSRRNNQQNAQVTTASSEARITARGSLVKGLAAIGDYARKATRSSSGGHK